MPKPVPSNRHCEQAPVEGRPAPAIRPSRVLALTGGTGFIGAAVARALSGAGWEIRALARSSRKARPLAELGIKTVIGDLHERAAIRSLVGGVDAVVHCAGAVRGREASDFNRLNVDGVARLAEIAVAEERAPRFLLISSLAARVPFLSHYATSKRLGEETLRAVAGETMSWAALRPPAVYGPGDRELLPLLQWMVRGIVPRLGPVWSRFSMLYVEDLGAAVGAWLASDPCPEGVFELHDGRARGYTWAEAGNIVAALSGRRCRSVRIPRSVLEACAVMSVLISGVHGHAPMLSPGKVRELTHPDWVCDNAAFTRATGWAPTVQLSEGVRLTLTQA